MDYFSDGFEREIEKASIFDRSEKAVLELVFSKKSKFDYLLRQIV